MNKMKFILLGLLVVFAIMPLTAQAVKIDELDNYCEFDIEVGAETCYTTLDFKEIKNKEKDLLDSFKEKSIDKMVKKEAKRYTKIGKIDIENTIKFDSFNWNGNKVTIIGTIKPATQNYWGIEGLYNSTWWNSSWNRCINSTIINDISYNLVNHPVLLEFTDLDEKQLDNSDLRLLDSFCGDIDSVVEIPFKVVENSSNTASLVILINLTADSNNTYALYFDNDNAVSPSYGVDDYIYDNFNDVSYDSDVWGRYSIGVIDSEGGDNYKYWYNVSFSGEICPQVELSSKYTFGLGDTWCYEWKMGLKRTNTLGVDNGWCWEGGGFHDYTGNTLYGFCEYANPFNFWVGMGDANNNIVGVSNTNTLVNDSATENIIRLCHYNNQSNFIRISNDTGVSWDYGWANITQIAGFTPKNLTIGASLSANCPFSEDYNASFDYVKPSNSNLTILFDNKESIPLLEIDGVFAYEDVSIGDSNGNNSIVLKYNISSACDFGTQTIQSANACFNLKEYGGTPNNTAIVYRINNQTWNDTIPPHDIYCLGDFADTGCVLDQSSNQTFINWNDTSSTLNNWLCLNVTDIVSIDFNLGNENATIMIDDGSYFPNRSFPDTSDRAHLYVGDKTPPNLRRFEDSEGSSQSTDFPFLDVVCYTPIVPVELGNATYTQYQCINDNSVKNTTIVSGNTTTEILEVTTCNYGCNDDNMIITMFDNDPNLCNPPEYFQIIILLIIGILLYGLYRRLK